jgi:hypothetical protein
MSAYFSPRRTASTPKRLTTRDHNPRSSRHSHHTPQYTCPLPTRHNVFALRIVDQTDPHPAVHDVQDDLVPSPPAWVFCPPGTAVVADEGVSYSGAGRGGVGEDGEAGGEGRGGAEGGGAEGGGERADEGAGEAEVAGAVLEREVEGERVAGVRLGEGLAL